MRSLVMSTLCMALNHVPNQHSKNKMQAFEMRYNPRLLNISNKGHKTYEDVGKKNQGAIGELYQLLTMGENGNSGGLDTSQGLLAEQ